MVGRDIADPILDVAGHAPLELPAHGGIECIELALPFLVEGGVAPPGLFPGGQNVTGNDEGFGIPAQFASCRGNLVRAQGRAVGGRRSRLAGRPESDDGAAGDETWTVAVEGPFKSLGDRLAIMAIHAFHRPVQGPETRQGVVGDGERGRPVDRDAVVVEQHDQAVEREVTGQRGGLVADSLHQAAIAGNDPGAVVDEVAEAVRHDPFAQGHADGVG